MATYLDRILDAHRRAAAEDRRPLGQLVEAARSQPPARGFRAALAQARQVELLQNDATAQRTAMK